jgi:3'-phosphoadenosine 5'-phosphosulfate sulfotransferase (PAPS reductase)/FAD synthetase
MSITDKIMGETPELRRMYLKQRQSLPLSVKVRLTQRRIVEWYEAHEGMVYVAFSGGKDSTALLHLVRSVYPEVPAVFADTGLEFPEIREFVKNTGNVVWVKPKKNFKQVITEYGYPVVSKTASKLISAVQNPTARNAATVNLAKTGLRRDGEKATTMKLAKKWHKLFDAPFKISDRCCEFMKKKPAADYAKQTGRAGITGIMAEDSRMRQSTWIRTGCNSFANNVSTPMAFWLESDVWEYLRSNNVPYCKIYDMGEKRTGCIFCMFGCHYDKERFVRLKKTHPDLHSYCMNQLGMAEVLDYLGLPRE